MLQSRLREIAQRLEHETPREAQRIAGEVVVRGAQMRVPKKTHLLERSIHAENVTEGDRHLTFVVADAEAPPTEHSRGGYPYGHIVEFGSSLPSTRNAPHPFMVPALEHGRREIEAEIAVLIRRACD